MYEGEMHASQSNKVKDEPAGEITNNLLALDVSTEELAKIVQVLESKLFRILNQEGNDATSAKNPIASLQTEVGTSIRAQHLKVLYTIDKISSLISRIGL